MAAQGYQDPGLQAADTEMRILEASIDKISELLAVAFGDAGVDIIAENMRCMGGLDPMVPGIRTVRVSLTIPPLASNTRSQTYMLSQAAFAPSTM